MALLDWNLAETLNVYQMALLSVGYNPAEYEDFHHGNWPKQVRIDTAAYLSTIKNAVLTGKIECEREYNQNDFDRDVNWYASLIDVQSYTRWLKERNHDDNFFNCAFFGTDESDLDRLLTPSGEYYAPKLAAAVRAWQAGNRSPRSHSWKITEARPGNLATKTCQRVRTHQQRRQAQRTGHRRSLQSCELEATGRGKPNTCPPCLSEAHPPPAGKGW
jgi:hypothetical protein